MDDQDVTNQSDGSLPPPAPAVDPGSVGLPVLPPVPPVPAAPSPSPPPVAADPIPAPPPTIDPNNPTANAPVVPATPATAEDSDLIEKEWVDKAKHIVDQTRTDPYKQNQEINKIKADYIKKRYNKDIKLDET